MSGRRKLTRAELLQAGGGAALALFLVSCGGESRPAASPPGDLRPDPDELLDLPPGFSYRILAPKGSELRDGLTCPGNHDGMGTFSGPGGTVVVVRNHELMSEIAEPLPGKRPFDPGESGCTSAVVVDSERNQLDAYLTSSGTRRNCGGGVTPWGTWLTCEETDDGGHGYVFEVQWDDPENELSGQPIAAMGRFSHEAVAFDPEAGLWYLTEDDQIDEVSFLYRFRPDDSRPRPGALHAGGGLEAASVGDDDLVSWVSVEPERAHESADDAGASRFRRLEGCAFSEGALWFADTSGGEEGIGAIYRYRPAVEHLELVVASRSEDQLDKPDNIGVAPSGRILTAEDGGGDNRLIGVSKAGRLTVFATAGEELAGPCFSPDGHTLFLNLYESGMTLAIRGPFAERLGA